jgi:hypothetical protein
MDNLLYAGLAGSTSSGTAFLKLYYRWNEMIRFLPNREGKAWVGLVEVLK